MQVRLAQCSLYLGVDPVELAPVTVQVYQVDQVSSKSLDLCFLYPENLPSCNPGCYDINLCDIPPYPLPEAFRTDHVREMFPIKAPQEPIVCTVHNGCCACYVFYENLL